MDAGGDARDGGAAEAGPDAGATFIDCALDGGLCPPLAIPSDSPQGGYFHGYFDPTMRRDPSSQRLYLAYSWAEKLSDGTYVLESHLSESDDHGATWTFDGVLFPTEPFANPGDAGAYAAGNHTSHEVIDLFPVDLDGGATLWVQAHHEYLVADGSHDIYAQASTTSVVSVSAAIAPGDGGLLALGSAPLAKLGNDGTDPTLDPTLNLSSLAGAPSCAEFDQPAFAMVGSTLYLALENVNCATGDQTGAFSVFSTQPAGADATKWTWSYVGTFVTATDAAEVGAQEGQSYDFFTELELAQSGDGGLLAIASGAVYATGGVQPYSQYGCRVMRVASLDPPALVTDSAGPLVLGGLTETDLYGGENQGPGACAYDPTSITGLVMIRKLEDDPTLGFYGSIQFSGFRP